MAVPRASRSRCVGQSSTDRSRSTIAGVLYATLGVDARPRQPITDSPPSEDQNGGRGVKSATDVGSRNGLAFGLEGGRDWTGARV